jgi:hypothetical protein
VELTQPLVGVDFDNTIVCYDKVFHGVALERELIHPDLPPNKAAVRDHLRRSGREQIWTELQGHVYGACMDRALPYPGVLDFFRATRSAGTPIAIISHKTRRPFCGPRHDLHQAALRWLEGLGFFDPAGIALPRDRVHFEPTKEKKLERIGRSACSHFIDDLPEFLSEPQFPIGVTKVLFDPNDNHSNVTTFRRASSWHAVARMIPQPASIHP